MTWETLRCHQMWLAGKPPLEVSEKNHRTKWGLFQHTMFNDTGGCCSFYYYTSIKIPSRAHYSPTNSHCMQNNAYTHIYIYYIIIYIYPLSLWFGKSINLSPIHQRVSGLHPHVVLLRRSLQCLLQLFGVERSTGLAALSPGCEEHQIFQGRWQIAVPAIRLVKAP